MDDSDIDDYLNEPFTDFSVSGSEYVPSDDDVNEGTDSDMMSDDDYSDESDSGSELDQSYEEGIPVGNQGQDLEDMIVEEEVREPVLDVVRSIHNNYVSEMLEWTDFKSTCKQFPFNAQPGLQVDFDLNDPVAAFKQFVDDELLDIVVTETNRYAHQLLSNRAPKKRAPMAKWKDCTKEEIKKFLGILMIMGICALPKRQMYWSKNPMYGNVVIRKTMPRDRFDCLMKCLHFHDNNVPVLDEPRLAKIKCLVTYVNNKFKEILVPDESVVIDESMIPWRGRLLFRQYLPGKAHKYGIKLYKICSTNGYTFKVKVYAGKSDVLANQGHAEKVVMELMDDKLQVGRTLYVDNFYTSVKLADLLLQNKTYLCGTLCMDRKGNPKSVTTAKISKGQMVSKENSSGVKCFKWRDKRVVMMLSTRPEDSQKLVNSGKRKRSGEEVYKPTAVLAYNNAKKGVDFSYQMASYYTPLQKSLAWYKKVALEILLGSCVVNAFVLCNQFGPRKRDMLRFRESIINHLLQKDPQPRTQTPAQQPNKKKHQLAKKEGSVRANRKRCVHCYQQLSAEKGAQAARKLSKRVVTFCNTCEGNPPMCIDCFNKNH